MSVVFSSQFRALPHGALNWDTQLDADLGSLETIIASALVSRSQSNDDQLQSGADWHALGPGVYRINAVQRTYTNTPPKITYGYGTLLVFGAGNSVTLVYFQHANGRVHHQTKYNDTDWSTWWYIDPSGS